MTSLPDVGRPLFGKVHVMVSLPHPTTAIMLLAQRHVEFLAESARDRRARSAERTGGVRSRQQWATLMATGAAVVVLALLAAAPVAYVALQ